MSTPISGLRSFDPTVRTRLAAAGITTVEGLLHKRSEQGDEALGRRLGVEPDLIALWARQADLMRLRGVGAEMTALLAAAGVTSCEQLRDKSAALLYPTLKQVNMRYQITQRHPTLTQVARWIDQACEILADGVPQG